METVRTWTLFDASKRREAVTVTTLNNMVKKRNSMLVIYLFCVFEFWPFWERRKPLKQHHLKIQQQKSSTEHGTKKMTHICIIYIYSIFYGYKHCMFRRVTLFKVSIGNSTLPRFHPYSVQWRAQNAMHTFRVEPVKFLFTSRSVHGRIDWLTRRCHPIVDRCDDDGRSRRRIFWIILFW